jgi:aminoglycoside phosphotransferase (APT) family kinase protein
VSGAAGAAGLADLADRVGRAARRRWPDARIGELGPLPGGISSITFSARLAGAAPGDRVVVVKVAPPGLPAVHNRDVLGQARVLAALHGVAGVSVPAVLLQDDGDPPFFVMEFVGGEAYEPRWDVSARPPSAAVIDARGRAAARMLAALHAVSPRAVGLGAEPVRTASEELERWRRLYATAGEDLRGDEAGLAAALAARLPAPAPARVQHGDYRLGNMQFQEARLAAIIDWELWSVGDPRADLAWLMMFADPVAQRVARRDDANRAAADAMPGEGELLAEYLRAAGGEEPDELRWFGALSCYKLGAAMAALAKRNRRRPEPDPGLELAARTTPAMLAHGLELLRSGPVSARPGCR